MVVCLRLFRTTRYAHWYDKQYHTIYIPFYTNMGSFVFGMIAGLLYCKHKQGHIDLTKSKVCQQFIIFSIQIHLRLILYSSCRYFGTVYCRLHFWVYSLVKFSTQIILKSQQFG